MSAKSLEIALAHAALGRRVFPFKLTPRAEGGFDKTPLVKWKSEATTDEDTIRGWARRFRTASYGWVLEEGLLVADVDDVEQLRAWLEEYDLHLNSDSYQETPSGGLHLLFSGLGARQTVKEIPGLDTRVGGKGWVGLYAIDSFSGEAPAAPAWLLMEKPSSDWSEPTESEPITTRAGLLELVGRLRWSGLDETELLAALLTRYGDGRITESDSSRPWTKQDFAAIASEFSKKPSGGSAPSITVRFVRHNDVEKADSAPVDYSFPLADIEETTPKPLLLGRLDPEDHTILFGTGGTGKGVIAAWWAAKLARDENMGVLVLDYEEHTRFEWRPRVRRFAGRHADRVLQMVRVVQPHGRPIWQEIPRLLAEIDRIDSDPSLASIGYVIIDSVTYAVGDFEAEKSGTATKYSKALSALGMPALSLAHTTKADADPRYPFGSVYWHNGARVTMSLVGEGSEPRILTQKKTNQRALFQAQKIDWSWTDTGTEPPEDLQEAEYATTWVDRFLEVAMMDWITVHQAVERMEEHGWKTTDAVIRNALTRELKDASSRVKRERRPDALYFASLAVPKMVSKSG